MVSRTLFQAYRGTLAAAVEITKVVFAVLWIVEIFVEYVSIVVDDGLFEQGVVVVSGAVLNDVLVSGKGV